MIRASYVDAIPEPWSRESPWTQYTLQDLAVNGKSRFYKPDIWHNVNLGVGKDFVSAAMCLLVRDLEGPNINEKFDILSKKYLQWCRVFHKTKYVTKLDKKMVGGAGMRDEPHGTWNKAALTVTLLEFLLYYCEENKEVLLSKNDQRFQYTLYALRALNRFVSGLYHEDLWIEASKGTELANAGKRFFRSYTYLAFLSGKAGQPMFSLKPKLHMILEAAIMMERQSSRSKYILNILSESCSMDEDFVGRLAFVARNVSPRLVSQRSIERYLVQAYLAWMQWKMGRKGDEHRGSRVFGEGFGLFIYLPFWFIYLQFWSIYLQFWMM